MIHSSVAEPTSPALRPSLVTSPQANAHNQRLTRCPHSLLIQERCSHGNHRWIRVPCNRWTCEFCGNLRLWRELYPELELAYRFCRSQGWTLKFNTFTWKDDDQGAVPGRLGANRRRLDIQHLKQALKRQGVVYNYLRVAEYHAKGTVHVHMLVASPYIHQALLAGTWKRHTRGAFIVHTEAVGMKCPRCWDGKEKDPRIRRRRIIVLKPGQETATCPTCSFTVNADAATEGTLRAALAETAKYITKNPLGKLTRSRGWSHFHTEALAQSKSSESSRACSSCPKPHTFVWWPEHVACDVYDQEDIEIAIGGPGRPSEHGKCACFDWRTDVEAFIAYEQDSLEKVLLDP